jgi:membrane protein
MKRRIIGYLSQCAWANKLEKYLEKIKINKKGTSLYQVGHIFVQDFERNDIIERAGGVAFSFTLAVFPAIIFMITLIPYIQQFYPEFSEANIMGFFQDVMPPSVFDAASTTIEDILGHKRGGLLSLGAILAFYLSTNGMMSLIKAFNRCYRTKDNRGYIKTFLIATFLTMILAFTLFIAVILLIIGQTVLEKFRDLGFLTQDYLFYSIVTSRFIVIVVIFFLSISLIFHFAPAVHDRWKMFSPGAFLATLLSLMVSYTFSFYISNFGTYNKLYGSIGAMIAFMVWLFLISVIILTGFELNASIDKANKINQERVHADKL